MDINNSLGINFTHHDELLSKTTNLEERAFYNINQNLDEQSIEQNESRE